MIESEKYAAEIKSAVNKLVMDKRITRPVLIEALEEAAGDIEGLLESLRDDQRREDESP